MLRSQAEVAAASRRNAAPMNNPQLRLGYSDSSESTDLEPLLDPLADPDLGLSDASEQYSAQIRFYPRNPFVAGAQVKRASMVQSRVELEYASAIHSRSLDVCENYLEMIRAHHLLMLKEEESKLQKEEDEQAQALFDAGRLSAEDYNEGQLRGLEILMELGDAEQAYMVSIERLQMDAGLSPNIDISHAYPKYLEADVAGRLNVEPLIDVMKANNFELSSLDADYDIARAELSASRAEGIPWLNLISATYQREERFDTKYRDEYRIVAGIELPVFDWLSSSRTAPAKAQVRGLDQQLADREKNLTTALEQSVNALKNAQNRREVFQEREDEIREELNQRLSEIKSDDDLLQKQQAIHFKRMLIELDEKSIRMKHDHALRVIGLERLLGVRLQSLM